MTLFDTDRVAGVVLARALQPGDIIQRRYRWTVQTVRVIDRDPGCSGHPWRAPTPARVLVRAHHTDRGEHGRTDTLQYRPRDWVPVARLRDRTR